MNYGRGLPSGITLTSLGGSAPIEVIPETQLVPMNGKGNMFKAILASIGLDNPTTSQNTRNNYDNVDQNHDKGMHMMNTPIRNSASNLIALGQHVFTPGQGKMWECRNKSPLGRL